MLYGGKGPKRRLDYPCISRSGRIGCPSQKSVRVEIIDFLAWACHVFIHDEDANETDLEYTFGI